MLHIYIKKFDVTGTVENFLERPLFWPQTTLSLSQQQAKMWSPVCENYPAVLHVLISKRQRCDESKQCNAEQPVRFDLLGRSGGSGDACRIAAWQIHPAGNKFRRAQDKVSFTWSSQFGSVRWLQTWGWIHSNCVKTACYSLSMHTFFRPWLNWSRNQHFVSHITVTCVSYNI